MPQIMARCRKCGREFDTGLFVENSKNVSITNPGCPYCDGIGDVITPRHTYDRAVAPPRTGQSTDNFTLARPDRPPKPRIVEKVEAPQADDKIMEQQKLAQNEEQGEDFDMVIPREDIKIAIGDASSFAYANMVTVQTGDENFFLTFGILDPSIATGQAFQLNERLKEAAVAKVAARAVVPLRVAGNLMELLLAGLGKLDPDNTRAFLREMLAQMDADNT